MVPSFLDAAQIPGLLVRVKFSYFLIVNRLVYHYNGVIQFRILLHRYIGASTERIFWVQLAF